MQQEKQARSAILKDDEMVDKIFRAYGILKSARMITCSEFTSLVSYARLGAAAGLIDIPLETLGKLLVEMQPATLNSITGKANTAQERDKIRAQKIREALK